MVLSSEAPNVNATHIHFQIDTKLVKMNEFAVSGYKYNTLIEHELSTIQALV